MLLLQNINNTFLFVNFVSKQVLFKKKFFGLCHIPDLCHEEMLMHK